MVKIDMYWIYMDRFRFKQNAMMESCMTMENL